MNKIRVLILEDDLETATKLLAYFDSLEKELSRLIAITLLAEYTQVEEYLNIAQENIFDLILLDRDCKAGGSFHVLDLNRYPVGRIISISSTPPYNEEAREKGIKRVVWKDYQNLDKFISELDQQIREIIQV